MIDHYNRNIRSVGIFCGSASGHQPAFAQAAASLGRLLAMHSVKIVYGGGNVGLMGILADAALAAGGQVTGVITEKLKAVELAHKGVQEMLVVSSMDERKTKIVELSDAFIAMPGGYGTFDELFEVLTLNQLHIIKKPVGLLNTEGYFGPFRELIAHGIRHGFIRSEHHDFFVMEEEVEKLLEMLVQHQPPETLKWLENFNKEKY